MIIIQLYGIFVSTLLAFRSKGLAKRLCIGPGQPYTKSREEVRILKGQFDDLLEKFSEVRKWSYLKLFLCVMNI